MKQCSRCKESKSLEAFGISKRHKDGLSYYCKECARLFNKETHSRLRDKRLKQFNEYRLKTLDKEKARNSLWRSLNKERKKLNGKLHLANNPHKYAAWSAKRNAAKMNATPKWLSKEHLKEIEEVYQLAKDLEWLNSEPLQVDHIVPLQGENVSGLHVPWNLQILSRSTNISKSNNF